MILALVDDLMFTSKIRAAATGVGASVMFARSSEGALAEMQRTAPTLVIFDLNSRRIDPLGTLAAMKADQTLAAVPTIGFVSHVDGATIDAARRAGIGELLARSTFTERLPDILKRGA